VASISVQTTWIPSPATEAGTYDIIGLVNRTAGSRFTTAGDFQLEVSKSGSSGGFSYQLDSGSGFLPGGLNKLSLPVRAESWDFNPGGPNYRYENPYGDYEQFFGQNLKEYETYSDGSKKLREDYYYNRAEVQNAVVSLPGGQQVSENLIFDVGLSYVAMGEWSWQNVTVNGGTATPTGDKNTIYFAYGSRTPAAGIPVSGTATYGAHSLGDTAADSIPFTLTADFGQRKISTQISAAGLFDVSGSAPFSNNGSFDIPLAGTAGIQTASGTMDGAFFGPHAEQVGGVFSVGFGGTTLMQDAFAGEQR
jgi:hypothetical protein